MYLYIMSAIAISFGFPAGPQVNSSKPTRSNMLLMFRLLFILWIWNSWVCFCFHMPFIRISPTKKYKSSLQNRYIRFPYVFPIFRRFRINFPTMGNLSVGIDVKKTEANMRTATCLDLLRRYQCLGEDMVGIKAWVLNAAKIALFSGGYI